MFSWMTEGRIQSGVTFGRPLNELEHARSIEGI